MGTTVTIERNLITQKNGKPFFLIGARHMPEGGNAALLAETGFNGYRWLPFGVKSSEKFLIDPPRRGQCIGFWPYIYDRAVVSRDPDYRRQLEDLVSSVKDHPEMLFYENYNEVAMKWKDFDRQAMPDELEEGTRLLRRLDPDHPIWLAHDCGRLVETLHEYNGCADIVGCNPYAVQPPGMKRHYGIRADGRFHDCPDQSVHSVGRYTEKMMAVGSGRKPVWMLIQAMANEHWFNPERSEADAIDESKILYPSYEEIRFMVFDAIISGATGLAFSMHKTRVGDPIWSDTKKVVAELGRLYDALCAPRSDGPSDISYTDFGFTVWDGVGVLSCRVDNTVYLFAANRAFDPAEVSMQLSDAKSGTAAYVEGEDREVSIEGRMLKDTFPPYGVHIYRYKAE